MKAVERIIDRAFSAKTDEDFQKVLALDLAFQRKEGYSALDAAGLSIETEGRGKLSREWNVIHTDWEFHYKLKLESCLTLPKPYTDERFTDE